MKKYQKLKLTSNTMPKKKKETETTEEQNPLQETLDMIQTKFGDGTIIKLGDAPKVDVDAISTGSIGLDEALGVGGIPRGQA